VFEDHGKDRKSVLQAEASMSTQVSFAVGICWRMKASNPWRASLCTRPEGQKRLSRRELIQRPRTAV
jgi:ribosomal protein L40E